MTKFDFERADWNLIRDLRELCKENLFDPENLAHNNHQVNVVLNAGWALFKLKMTPILELKDVDMKKLFNEFEEWFLGTKYTEVCSFENFLLEEVIK